MNYIQYEIIIHSEYRQILQAFLGQLPFETFEDTEEGFRAYLPEGPAEQLVGQRLEKLKEDYSFSYERSVVADQNWNEVWESSFQPVKVEHFCQVRADFHPSAQEMRYDIVINPKMAFGTGHHETTYMMIAMMQAERFKGAKVLDYGCGTGILAILAAQMGATAIDAVDIEEASYQNTMENAQINNVDSVQAIHGTLDSVLDTAYDLILANINRNVILEALPALYDKLNKRGVLLVSGILHPDLAQLKAEAGLAGFTTDDVRQKGEWVALRLLK